MAITINKQIKEHARASNTWKYQALADKAYSIFEVVNERLYKKDLPDVIIGFDTRLKKAGQYYEEGDSVSLNFHFDLNPDINDFELVLAVIHNSAHASLVCHKGKASWYHSKLFRDEMAEWGIECNDGGDAIALDPVLLTETLKRIGQEHLVGEILDFNPVEDVIKEDDPLSVLEPEKPKKVSFTANKNPAKNTKMRKWSCACNPPTNVRCATNLEAQCNVCYEEFTLQ